VPSTNAIIDAFNYIRLGHADVMVTGGSEAAVTIAGMGGFNAMHALSTRNDQQLLLDQWTRTETDLF
jgi:3-oxoacyl-[acyl-carrier-protein] synthase II